MGRSTIVPLGPEPRTALLGKRGRFRFNVRNFSRCHLSVVEDGQPCSAVCFSHGRVPAALGRFEKILLLRKEFHFLPNSIY